MYYDRFLTACNEKGVSPTTALVEMGLSKSNDKAWREGRVPTPKTIKKVAAYFGKTPEEFMQEPAEKDMQALVKRVVIERNNAPLPKEQEDMLLHLIDSTIDQVIKTYKRKHD